MPLLTSKLYENSTDSMSACYHEQRTCDAGFGNLKFVVHSTRENIARECYFENDL